MQSMLSWAQHMQQERLFVWPGCWGGEGEGAKFDNFIPEQVCEIPNWVIGNYKAKTTFQGIVGARERKRNEKYMGGGGGGDE